ncbi:MAG: hypothetical protein WBD58_14200 [Geitlerinemataceae cyanobacterium]
MTQKKKVRHPAASEEECEKMAKRYGWHLKETERKRTGFFDPLPVDCIFEKDVQDFDSFAELDPYANLDD